MKRLETKATQNTQIPWIFSLSVQIFQACMSTLLLVDSIWRPQYSYFTSTYLTIFWKRLPFSFTYIWFSYRISSGMPNVTKSLIIYCFVHDSPTIPDEFPFKFLSTALNNIMPPQKQKMGYIPQKTPKTASKIDCDNIWLDFGLLVKFNLRWSWNTWRLQISLVLLVSCLVGLLFSSSLGQSTLLLC